MLRSSAIILLAMILDPVVGWAHPGHSAIEAGPAHYVTQWNHWGDPAQWIVLLPIVLVLGIGAAALRSHGKRRWS